MCARDKHEIEITPEMVEAGMVALLDSGYPEDCSARAAITQVFQAMELPVPSHKERSTDAPSSE